MRCRVQDLRWAVVALLSASAALCLSLPAAAFDCRAVQPSSSAEYVVTVDPSTAWQPRGGQVRIVVQSNTQALKDVALEACFKWSDVGADAFQPAPLVQLVEIVGNIPGKAVYAITVPDAGLPWVRSNWFGRLFGSGAVEPGDPDRYDAARIVPIADLRIVLGRQGAAAPVAVVDRPVGITSVWTAAGITGGTVLVTLFVLVLWARARLVPGTDPLMRLITTRDGYVSLSQFQIVMWSYLFGAGAVYVMGLSGSLIDIPSGALVLLGISGATIVGAKINDANTKAQPASPPPSSTATARPDPPTSLVLSNVTDRRVRLSWTAPAIVAGAEVAAYIVRYAEATTAIWKTATDSYQGITFDVTGLQPLTAYLFEVRASNAAGQSPAVQGQATTAAPVQNVRIPSWSDLVVTPEHPGEIDVTRVQMLLFTLIAAGFVAIKLFNSYVIPDIPPGILVLMGISNGTYLSAKFVRN